MIHTELFQFDKHLRALHGPLLCGVDEAGRGPLAGPVAAAAVILPPHVTFDAVCDSKKMSEKKREALFDEIYAHALSVSVVLIDNSVIDRINILRATLLAMQQAIEALSTKPDFLLIDGNCLPTDLTIPAEALIKGDAISASVAAASVIAKVTRDRLMKGEMQKEYPHFSFERHKGYPTKQHYSELQQYGPTPIHRRTFLKGSLR